MASKRWIVVGVSVSVLAVSGVWTVQTLAQNKREIDARVYRPDPDAKVRVEVATVERGALDDEEKVLGTFEPVREVVVGSPAQGRVLRVGVAEGDRIKAGQLVAQLDGSVLDAQLPGLEASLLDAQRDHQRSAQLGKEGALALAQVDRSQATLAASESQLATLKRQLGQTLVVAPFAGVVTGRHFDVGAVVSTGTALVDLVDISRMKLVVAVPERKIATLSNGKKLEVVVDAYSGKTFEGVVSMVGVQGDGAHSFPVHVMVDNVDATPLRAGMYGSVRLGHGEGDQAISIPRAALVGSVKSATAYVVEGGVARQREIGIGRATNERFEVIRGLSVGDVVVTSGQLNLRDGSLVATDSESGS